MKSSAHNHPTHDTFDQTFQQWYEPLVYFAHYFTKDLEVAKDLVSDAFEYLWINNERLDPTTVKAYLYSIVRARCIDHLRKKDIHERYIDFATELSQHLAERQVDSDEPRIAAIRRAMQKLTPYNAHILEECYLNNKKYKEVAQQLNVSVAAIHKNIVKALRILRQELTELGNQKAT